MRPGGGAGGVRHPRAAALAAAAAAHLAAGCYSEVPVRWDAAPADREVEVTLDAAEAAGLAATLGPRARQLAGRVTARTDSTLTLNVEAVTRTSGTEESWPGGAVVLPGRAVERVTVRRLSAVRTAVVIGGIAAGGLLAGKLAGDASASGPGRSGGTPGQQ